MSGAPKPKCFVISEIGAEGTAERKAADDKLKYVIRPAAEECGYEVKRADEIEKAGRISSQIIRRLVEDELVIADLTNHNPNVFYELAIRHVVHKPTIQLFDRAVRLPFDVGDQRSIHIGTDVAAALEAKDRIIEQIKDLENDPDQFETPISAATASIEIRASADPNAQLLSALMDQIDTIASNQSAIQNQLAALSRRTTGGGVMPPNIWLSGDTGDIDKDIRRWLSINPEPTASSSIALAKILGRIEEMHKNAENKNEGDNKNDEN